MANLSQSDKYELEKLIDKAGLSAVAFEIGEICFAKEEHIITNYPGGEAKRSATSYWNRAGRLFDSLSTKVKVK